MAEPHDPTGPPRLLAHDPEWAVVAEHHLAAVRAALEPLVDDVDTCRFDHIGSTSVPGLAAKDVVDLQALLPEVPGAAPLDAALAPLGWWPARGARPDSPGVTRDVPGPHDTGHPDEVWAKRLFTRADASRPALLHVRLTASPFGRHTVTFRDRLRSEPELRGAYEQLKRTLSARHADAADWDDYTRAKTDFVRDSVRR